MHDTPVKEPVRIQEPTRPDEKKAPGRNDRSGAEEVMTPGPAPEADEQPANETPE